MSVIKSERSTSSAQFIETARDLLIFTIGIAERSPNRHSTYICKPMVDIATKVLQEIIEGNSIFPANAEEAQLRLNHFIEAKATLEALIVQIGVAIEVFNRSGYKIKEGEITRWMYLVDKERKLLKGLIRADRDRYKKFRL